MTPFRTIAACLSLALAAPVAAQAVTVTQPNYVATDAHPKAVAAMNQIDKSGGVVGPGTTIATSQTAVTTSATQVCPQRAGRQMAVLTETSAVDFYWGPAGVTPLSGSFVKGVAGASVSVPETGPIYAIASGPVTITCGEVF